MGCVQWVEEFQVGSGVAYDTGIAFLASPEADAPEIPAPKGKD
jgi:hypothetical protein